MVFGLPSGLISRCVDERLQVCLCSSYDLCATLVNIRADRQIDRHTDRVNLTNLYEKLRAKNKNKHKQTKPRKGAFYTTWPGNISGFGSIACEAHMAKTAIITSERPY